MCRANPDNLIKMNIVSEWCNRPVMAHDDSLQCAADVAIFSEKAPYAFWGAKCGRAIEVMPSVAPLMQNRITVVLQYCTKLRFS